MTIGSLPIGLSTNLGAAAGAAIHGVLPVRRKVVRRNLELAFGDTHSPEERHRLERMTYRHLGMLGAECLRLWHSHPDWLASQIVEIEGREVMERLESSGAPFLVVTGHFGNWEMLGAYFGERFRLSVVAKPLHNAALEAELSAKRQRYGMEILSTGSDQIGRDILRAVRRGRTVCFLADQDARKAGIFVPFFGRSASTFTGPALMALRLRIPLVPVFLLRLGPGRHRVVIREPLNPPEGLPTEQAVDDLTQAHVKTLEDMIRLAPSQYFWFHRRWKTQPKP